MEALVKVTKSFFPFIFLILLPFLVFWRAAFGGDIFIQGSNAGSDLLYLNLPFKYILHDAVYSGQIPLWNSHLATGFPIFAEGQIGALYPINLILAFLPPYLALNYSVMIAMVIGGVGMYLFALTFSGIRKRSAVFVAVVFMFSSFFIARMQHVNLIVAGAYVHILLLLARKYFVDFKLKWFIYAGLVFWLQILVGHPGITYYSLLMFMWWIGGELIYLWLLRGINDRKWYGNVLRTVIRDGIIFLVTGILLSAVQLLPTWEFSKQTYRAKEAGNLAWATQYSFHPAFFSCIFNPYCLGNPSTATFRREKLYGIWWENLIYIGIIPALLCFWMLFRAGRRGFKGLRAFYSNQSTVVYQKLNKINSKVYFLAFLAITIVVFGYLILGRYSLLFAVAYYLLPGMNLFRVPGRFNLMIILAMCLLAGYALEFLLARVRFKLLFYGIIFVLALADLIHFAYSYTSFLPASRYMKTPEFVPVIKQSERDAHAYRIYQIAQYSIGNPFYEWGWKNDSAQIYSFQETLTGNFPVAYQMDSFSDYGWAEGGMRINNFNLMEKNLLNSDEKLDHIYTDKVARLLGIWNVKYFITGYKIPYTGYSLIKTLPLDSRFNSSIYLYSNQYVMPRAYLTAKLVPIADKDFLNSFFSIDSDGYDHAYVSEAVNDRGAGDKDFSSVTIKSYTDTKVEMEVSPKNNSYLIFSDIYYPGWNAYVDGAKQDVYRVNLIQRGLKLGQGKHEIVWRYEPMTIYVGAAISIITAVVLVILGLITLVRKNKYVKS